MNFSDESIKTAEFLSQKFRKIGILIAIFQKLPEKDPFKKDFFDNNPEDAFFDKFRLFYEEVHLARFMGNSSTIEEGVRARYSEFFSLIQEEKDINIEIRLSPGGLYFDTYIVF